MYHDDNRPLIVTAQEVTDEILEMCEQTFESWFDDDEPIEWDHETVGFWARLESDYNLDLGDQLDSPAMRKIQKHVRAYKRTM